MAEEASVLYASPSAIARRAAGEIKAFAPGEEFSPFYAPARQILDACPELKKDRDCANGNHGITLVLFNS